MGLRGARRGHTTVGGGGGIQSRWKDIGCDGPHGGLLEDCGGTPKDDSVLSTQDSQMLRDLAQEDRHGSKTYQTRAMVQSLSRLCFPALEEREDNGVSWASRQSVHLCVWVGVCM